MPAGIRDQSLDRLDDRLRAIVEEFEARFPHPGPIVPPADLLGPRTRSRGEDGP